MSAPVFELRTYEAAPGRMPDLLARFRAHTIRLFARHGIHGVGYWSVPEAPDTLVYLVRHDRDPDEAWADFQADPEWVAARAASLADGPLTITITAVRMAVLDLGPADIR